MMRLYLTLLTVLLTIPPLAAQDLEPRLYTNLPVGQTFMVLGAVRSDGDLSPTPSSPLQDAQLTIDSGVLGVAHSFALAGRSAKMDVSAGRVCYEGSAVFQGEPVSGRRCEYLDPKIRLGWNFYGAPAMPPKEFMQWTPGVVVGASVQVSLPWGSYTQRQLINAGTNRWMIRPGIGMSRHLGRWGYELMASVRFFGDNDDFYGGVRKEQEPLYSVQGHLIYRFDRGRWVSLNGNWFEGGESEVAGRSLGDRMENSRWGVTFSTPLNSHHSLKFYANTGVVTRIGNDFDSFGLAWQYRF